MDDLSLSEDDRSSRDSEKEVDSDDDENRSRTGDRESDEDGERNTKSDEDSEQPPGSDEDGEQEDVDIKNIRLCREHPAGAMTRDCKVCNDGTLKLNNDSSECLICTGYAPLTVVTVMEARLTLSTLAFGSGHEPQS